MKIEMQKVFVRATVICAMSEKLNLTNEQLRSLYKECIAMARYLGEIPAQVTACEALADVSFKLSQFEEARTLHEFCLKIAKQTGDKRSQARAYGGLGICCFSLGQYNKAITYLEIHVNIAKQIGDKVVEGAACGNLGNCYHSLGQYDEAIRHHEKRLNIAKQTGDVAGEGRAYGNLGNCYHSLGQYEKAIKYHERYLNIAKKIGDKLGEGKAYSGLSNCYYSLGQFDKAINYCEVNLGIAKQFGDKAGEGTAYGNLGNYYCALGDFDKAINHHELRLNIAKQIGDKAGEGGAYGNLGICYHSLGQYFKAVNYHKMCLRISIQNGDKTAEGFAYGGLGNCYCSLGQYDKAIKHHEICKEIAQQIGDVAGKGRAYNNLGLCYHSLGQYGKAIKHHQMYLKIAKQIGDVEGEGGANGNLGNCYESLGQYDKAIKHLEIYLNITKQIGDKPGEGQAYGSLGNCYSSLGQYDKAIKHHEMHLNIAKQVGDKADEGKSYGSLGYCYHLLGQYDRAMKYHEAHLSIAKKTGDKAHEGRAYSNIGIIHYSVEQYKQAELRIREGVRCFEELFENAPKQDKMKISILDTFFRSYRTLTQTLVLQDKSDEALVIAERGRARALAELMFKSYSVQCAEVNKASILNLVEIHKVVKSMGRTVLFLSLHFDGIYTWIIQLNGDVKFKKIVVSPQLKDHLLTGGVHLVAEQINTLISKFRESRYPVKCEDRSLAFSYYETECEETEDEATSRLWSETAVPKQQVSSSFIQSRESAKLEENTMETSPSCAAVAGRQNTFAKPEESEEINPLEELYRIVVGPVRQFIEGSQLVVVPDGPLHLVPFSALMDEGGHYVADSLQVRLVPSLTTAKMIIGNQLERNSQGDPLIVGDPDAGPRSRLPGANTEARMVGKLFNTRPLTGKEATKETFLQKSEKASFIHIAAHGNMERGEILLASKPETHSTKVKKEDTILTMADLENKRLKAKLVVLSCCHSARGEIRAEGVVGIARAFLGAGARSVLVALWAINDEATLYFMKQFYEHLTRGKRAGESLNRAMAAMRATAVYCDPGHWSPFVLIGDDVTVC